MVMWLKWKLNKVAEKSENLSKKHERIKWIMNTEINIWQEKELERNQTNVFSMLSKWLGENLNKIN